MPGRRDDSWLKAFVSRICEQIEGHHGSPPNYVEVRGLIQRFVKNNPEADPEDVDWVSHYDPRLEYSEILGRFRRAYPMYRWDAGEAGEEYGEERYFNELLGYLAEQARELPPDLRLRLIRELSMELGLHAEDQKRLEGAVAEAEPPKQRPPEEEKEEGKRVVIDLRLLAKYPMLDEAREVASGFSFDEAPEEAYERARERVLEAVEKGVTSHKSGNPLTELLSFPLASAIVAYFNNDWLRRRYAYAEGRRVERLLVTEEPEVAEFIASRAFATARKAPGDEARFGGYKVNLREYLQASAASGLNRDPRWKLVNRVVHRGYVYLNAAELARMVRARAQAAIAGKLSQLGPRAMPEKVRAVAEAIRPRIMEALSRIRSEITAIPAETPPCMKTIQARILAGEDVSHLENFAIAAYLLSTGKNVEDVLELFRHRGDYDERVARYQVEHIAGQRGGRTRYRPPSCGKLKSIGLCYESGRHCPKGIRSPLQYRPLKKEVKGAEGG